MSSKKRTEREVYNGDLDAAVQVSRSGMQHQELPERTRLILQRYSERVT
jgi:hypothetical protein